MGVVLPQRWASFEHLHVSVACEDEDGGCAIKLLLNRPRVLNALNMEMVDELHEILDDLMDLEDIRVVVLLGAGRGFCAGADIKASSTGTGGRRWNGAHLANQERFSGVIAKMRRIPQPIVVGVKGPAAGGGFSLMLAADVRIAGESAVMHAAFVQLGLSGCELGSSYFLPRAVGPALANELLLTGTRLKPDRAVQFGLVSRVVADDDLVSECLSLAQQMLNTSRLGLRLTKQGLQDADSAYSEASHSRADRAGLSLEATLTLENRGQVLCLRDQGCRKFGQRMVQRLTAKL